MIRRETTLTNLRPWHWRLGERRQERIALNSAKTTGGNQMSVFWGKRPGNEHRPMSLTGHYVVSGVRQ
jgi:hypothetical protein